MIVPSLVVLIVCLALALWDERRRTAEIVTRVTLSYERELERVLLERDGEAMYRRDAEQRLVGAWKDGFHVPPSDLPPYEDPREQAPLDPVYANWLSQYEGDARVKYERIIRRQPGFGSRPPLEVLKVLEDKRNILLEPDPE